MIGYTSTQGQYQIQSSKRKGIFAQTAITFNKTKSDIHLLDEYLLIAMPAILANLSANLSAISYAPRKQKRPNKETGLATAILDFNVRDIIIPSKRACLFLKLPKLPPSIYKVAKNVIEVSNKIVESDIYKEII